jgi:hypothetical protein
MQTFRRNILSPSSGLICRWRQYISPKRLHLPTSLHGTETQKNSSILTSVKTSNLTIKILCFVKYVATYRKMIEADVSLTISRFCVMYIFLYDESLLRNLIKTSAIIKDSS